MTIYIKELEKALFTNVQTIHVPKIDFGFLSKQFENLSAFSYYDVGESQSKTHIENVYHAFCLGMLIVANDRGYIIDSSQEYGLRRCDLKIVPKSGVEVDLPEVKKLLEIGISLKGKNACVLRHRFRRTEEGTWKKEQEHTKLIFKVWMFQLT
ncbi:hypothetical protein Glove_22g37 [Diversispora epigaea]|uniref:Uncharacterized protein n=1 Tax=Diversispora epigaea TaxID=1348612 RepID=A0A397JJ93_9GLOM|nr:hypothetical protein Glove_22g37 [Diversispora epigaea]